jgi:type III secretion system (T3SS) inner membrane Yop/YscD-like protein
MRPVPRSSVPAILLLLLAFVLGFVDLWSDPSGSTLTEAVGVGSLRARPSDFWGRAVRIVGSVRDLGPNRYRLVDRSGEGVLVQTSRSPGQAADLLVVAMVGQDPENSLRPLLVELDRDTLRRSIQSVLVAVGCVLAVSALGIWLVVRTDRRLRRALVDGGAPSDPDLAEPPLLRLEILQGPDAGKVFELDEPQATIGRPGERANNVSLSDMTISRTQGRIARGHGGFVFYNESSTNPTRINGQAVPRAELLSGDRLEMGESVLRIALVSRPRAES